MLHYVKQARHIRTNKYTSVWLFIDSQNSKYNWRLPGAGKRENKKLFNGDRASILDFVS